MGAVMVKTYISVLRGVNVGGHKKVKMDALRAVYLELGFVNVCTYIQSGNVIFQDGTAQTNELERVVGLRIAETFGFEVPVIVLELSELRDIVRRNPFAFSRSDEATHLYVTFLSSIPSPEAIGAIREAKFTPDECHVTDRAAYLFCPGGYGKTKFTNTFVEGKLKVVATTRNWKTAGELLAIAEKVDGSSGSIPR